LRPFPDRCGERIGALRGPVVIDRRYCGPKNSANGGYAAGVFARVIDGPAEVTLKAPPRFDVPIAFERDG
jgi:hypothetical protein